MLSPFNPWRAALDAVRSERDLERFLRAECDLSREEAEAIVHAAKRVLPPPASVPRAGALRRLAWRFGGGQR